MTSYPALIDCDVHEDIPGREELMPYFSKSWRDFAGLKGMTFLSPFASYGSNPWGYQRKDSVPPGGGRPGSSPQFMIHQLIDPFSVTYAVLTGDTITHTLGALANPHLAREVGRATNDYRADNWLAVDKRFVGSIGVPTQVPEWAAQEIRRCADNPRFVQVLLGSNPHAYAFGHPMFDAIHKACADTARPLAVHALGQSVGDAGVATLAGGRPAYYSEYHSGAVQEIMTLAMSFIFHGVFERYPSLKLVLVEAGSVGWVAPFLKRLDTNFKGLRREVPWCKKLPSEYFREHVAVTTQPFDHDSGEDQMLAVLNEYGAEDFLLFSTDYPHWDADNPMRALNAVPPAWREKIAYKNAAALYSLQV